MSNCFEPNSHMHQYLLGAFFLSLIFLLQGCDSGSSRSLPEDTTQKLQITPAVATIDVQTSLKYAAITIDADGHKQDVTEQVSWRVTNSAVAISNNAIITSVAVGTTQVEARLDNLSASTELKVIEKKLVELSIHPAVVDMKVSTSENFRVFAKYENSIQNITLDANWRLAQQSGIIVAYSPESGEQSKLSSEDAGLRQTFVVGLAVKPGQDTLIVNFKNKEAARAVQTTALEPKSLLVTPEATSLQSGTARQFNAHLLFEDGSTGDVTSLATWSSQHEAIATIETSSNNNGLATALSEGTTKISATFDGLFDETELSVHPAENPVIFIDIFPVFAEVSQGTEIQFSAFARFSDGTFQDITHDIFWESSNESIATIANGEQSGNAMALNAGSATISATFGALSSSTTLMVSAVTVTDLQIEPAVTSLVEGTSVPLTATAFFSDGSSQIVTQQAVWFSSNEEVVTITPDEMDSITATALSEGIATIYARFQEVSSQELTIEVTVVALEAIQLAPLNHQSLPGDQVQYQVTGIYADNTHQTLTDGVSWQSSDPTVATVTTAGLASAIKPGITTILATFSDQSASTSLQITDAEISQIIINPTNALLAAGTAGTLQATAHLSDGNSQEITRQASWLSSDNSIVSIVTSGINAGDAKALSVGSATITATLEGIISEGSTINVTAATLESLQLTPINQQSVSGKQVQYQLTGIFSDNTHQIFTTGVSWQSSEPVVATIDVSGLATAVSAGVTEITATVNDQSITTALLITDATVSELSIIPINTSMAKGTTDTFQAVAHLSDGSSENVTRQASWRSSDNSVVNIITSGIDSGDAEALAIGNAVVTATFQGVTTSEAAIDVTAATLELLQLAPLNHQSLPGIPEQYTLTGIFSDNTHQTLTTGVNWQSSNPVVATVDLSGLATLISAGITEITATFDGQSTSTNLQVADALISQLTITPVNAAVAAGATGTFEATAVLPDGSSQNVTRQVTWLSSDPTVVSIITSGINSGDAEALTIGTSSTSATYRGITSSEATINVTAAKLESLQLSPLNQQALPSGQVQYTLTGFFSDGSQQNLTTNTGVNWQSSNTKIATIDDSGLATALSAGITSITAAIDQETATTDLLVTPETVVEISIIQPRNDIAIGTTGTFMATATMSGGSSQDVTRQATWLSSDPKVVSVVTSGIDSGDAQALDVGTVTMTATFQGVTSMAATLNVTGAELLSLQISPLDHQAFSSDTVQYQVTGLFSDNSSQDLTDQATWQSSAPAVATIIDCGQATVDNCGLVSTHAPGATTILAIFNPDTNTMNNPLLHNTSTLLTVVEKGLELSFREIDQGGDPDSGDFTGVLLETTEFGDSIVVEQDIDGKDSAHIESVQVLTKAGNDILEVGADIKDEAFVNMGDGDDQFILGGNVQDSSVLMGSGNDEVDIFDAEGGGIIDLGDGDDVATLARISSSATVLAGAGNDTLEILDVSSTFDSGRVELGDGADILIISDTLSGSATVFDGGNGNDLVILKVVNQSNWKDVEHLFINFEEIELSDGRPHQ